MPMSWKNFLPALLTGLLSCTGHQGPDVSAISVEVKLKQFHTDFFSMDTTAMGKSLENLRTRYPAFLPLFLEHVLGLDEGSFVEGSIEYIRQNAFLDDEAKRVFPDLSSTSSDFEKAFKYVRYYFPEYRLPELITIVGPLNAFARTESGELSPNFMGPGFLALSLQFYLGSNFPVYKEEGFIFNVAPEYRSRRFDKKYIVADAMKLLTDDLFPEKSGGMGLIEKIVEKGKQWWLLDKLLPYLPDSLKTGYTGSQLKFCDEYEGLIWNTIITNEKDLYTRNPIIIQTYLGEAPTTQVMPSSSPGNIGQWVGWKIVEKFAENNPDLSVSAIMKTAPEKIFTEAKYKPK